MTEQEFNKLICVFLVKRHKGQLDSYSLVRLLTRRFNIYNFVEIIEKIVSDGYVKRYKLDNQEGFKITDIGDELIQNNHINLKQKMHKSFPEQIEFLEILFT